MSAIIVGRASEAAQDRLTAGYADYLARRYPGFRWEVKRADGRGAVVAASRPKPDTSTTDAKMEADS
ncbi:MAG: hypothetical protein WEB79_08455 [Thermoleophilaceae bacterium]